MIAPTEVVPFTLPPPIPPPVTLADVVISHELLSRRIHTVPLRIEMEAMCDLANLLAAGTPRLMKRLAQMAVELCNAGSGGISMLETGADGNEQFRWQALAGSFERYEGGTTPREWSPCGQCLIAARAMLYSYPGRYFTYFQDVDTEIVEGLVIPMFTDGQPIGTIWIVSHDEQRKFNAEDVRIMTSLASFVSAAGRLSSIRRTSFAATSRTGQEVVWAELVRRIAIRDSSALAALIDQTKPVVFARALRILGFRADAEEITMDVYSHVWSSAASYDPERGSVLVWMLNIARNCALDRLRSRGRQQRSYESLYQQCSSSADADGHAAGCEARRDVHRALQALPFEQRRAIELAYLLGYSMTDIASRLGHPLGTVKSRIRCGLIGLRRLMAAVEHHPSILPSK